jgi:N-acyl-D-amino-acid deacylase
MRRREFLSCAAAVSAAAFAGQATAKTTAGEQADAGTYDLVLKNGQILDGTGNPRFKADIAVKDGRIRKIGKVSEAADRIIDVEGLQ